MDIAESISLLSTCTTKLNRGVGAVIVLNNKIVGTGYNGAPSGQPHCDDVGCVCDFNGHCVSAIHAEANAILQAGQNTVGATLYCTHFPCIRCANMIAQAGIVRVVYKYEYVSAFLAKTKLVLPKHEQFKRTK